MKDISSLKTPSHYSVMLDEVLQICEPENGGIFVDCTFGIGGYTKRILNYPNTKVIAIDRDDEAIKIAKNFKKNFKNRFTFHHLKFSDIHKVLKEGEKVDNVIFDLGISSTQIFNMKRGFSFNSNYKPDMRMGLNTISALDVLNNLDVKTLGNVIKIFGEEKEGSKIAKNIVKYRKQRQIKLVSNLVNIINNSKKRDFKKKINPSTKTFQAIRIFVNNEISELIEGLIKATKILKKDGKLIIVSFHSIEDKIIKFFFKNFAKNKSRGSRYYPDFDQKRYLFKDYKNQVIRPSISEIKQNNPSRSAKLRFVTRSKEDFFYPIELKNKFINYLKLESTYV